VAIPHGFSAAYFADELDRLSALERDGIVQVEGVAVTIDETYWPLARTVASMFDAYLQPEEQRHAAAI
jgi:oxygen-independent coproporphyrinogen-3 oxidase